MTAAAPAAGAAEFTGGVLVAAVIHTLRLMVSEGWTFEAAAAIARAELLIVLHVLAEAEEVRDLTTGPDGALFEQLLRQGLERSSQ